MAVEQIAAQHAERQVTLARRASTQLGELWRQIDKTRIAASWGSMLPQALAILGTSQATAAASAGIYVDDVLEASGVAVDEAAGRVLPGAFAGIASDGRPLASLLLEPPITALTQIKGGASPAQALNSGRFLLDLITRTQVADAGRTAVGTAIVARPQVTGYVRMIVGKTCPRCLILAGKKYRWNKGFQRHPRCDCRHVPVAGTVPDDVTVHPKAYFDSLSKAEQDALFGHADAEAIRSGADMGKVVNARRGMFTADNRLYTREAAGRRPRIMPEQIFRDATSREDAIRLLRRHGYITNSPLTVVEHAPVRPTITLRPASFNDRVTAAAKDQDALAASRFGLDRRPRPQELTPEMARAINAYTGAEYNAINRQLRGLPLPYGYEPADVLPTIAGMDRALAASHLDRDVVVYRGVLDASQMFGSRLSGDLTGMQWREDAYLSTTARKQTAGQFAGKHGQAPMQMRIVVPKGTPAIEASGMNLEAELLLGRGQRLRIVADRGIGPDGVRHVDVEVIR